MHDLYYHRAAMHNRANGRTTHTCQCAIERSHTHNVNVVRRTADGSNSATVVRVGNTQHSAVVEDTTTTTGSAVVHTTTTTNQPTRQPRARAISIAAGHANR